MGNVSINHQGTPYGPGDIVLEEGTNVTLAKSGNVVTITSGGGGSGAPTDADYLVGTASAGLSAEIVVGTAPGGELGGTWAAPTVDATHSGSSHAGVQAAAEATAAGELAAHVAAADPHTGYQKESEKAAANGYASLGAGSLVPTAELGSGSATSSTFLRGDQTWATPAGGGEAFPVGSVFIAVVATNPGTLLGYGTWSAFGAGRVLVGLDAADADFDTAEETGGAKTHTLTSAEMPAHTHVQDPHSHVENQNSATTGSLAGWGARDTSTNTSIATSYSTAEATAVNQSAGGGGAHNNLQPYIVAYFWKRTA